MKRIKNIIIYLLIILILSGGINCVRAVTISVDSLNNSITKINKILEDKVDATNPNYITEILDENGNVPGYKYYPKHIDSRSIKVLKAYDGKIFMGLGDWNDNTGPAKIIYYDTTDEQIKTSGTIEDEAVQQFSVIDDTLYTTGCDPRAGWGYGSYYTYNKQDNKWEQHLKNNGWIHVFNIIKFKDKIFMCGSTSAETKTSTIQSSSDNGETFENIDVFFNGNKLPYNSNLRCYNLVEYNNKLYAYYYHLGGYSGIYEYNEEKNEFNYISDLPSRESYDYSLATSTGYNHIYLKYSIFNNSFIFVSGTSLYKSTDLKKFEKIETNTFDAVQDVAIDGDTMYTLSYVYNRIDKTFTTRIYKTKDLSNFELVYEFTTDTPPFSVEYYDNSIYVGTGHYNNDTSEFKDINKNGSLYRINLEKAKRSIKLNKDNKTVEISDNGETFSAEYDLSNEKAVFKIDLNFKKEMTQNEWKQEYTKLRNLNLIFATIADNEGADFDKSTSYFNNVLYKNSIEASKIHSSAIEYAREVFQEELNIQDDLFSISTAKVVDSEEEYKTQITLTINADGDYTELKPVINKDDTDDSNNDVNQDTNTDAAIDNNTSIDNDEKENSEVKDFTNTSGKIPQAGKIFDIKDLLQIIIFISALGVVFILKRNKE